jgi:uncharacterized protein (TIGR02147 family)
MFLKTNRLLTEKFNQKKVANPSFSIRAWASQMGLNSHGGLQQILAGKRTVPKKYIPAIIKSLELTPGEAMYFETLVDLEKSKTPEEKDIYNKRLTHLRPNKKPVQVLEIENFKYFQNPLHSIIRTMIERKDFVYDPEKIKRTLRLVTTRREIKEVVERLIALGLVSISGEKLKKNHKHIKNKIDIPSRAVEDYHQKMSQLAAEEIKKQPIEQREFNSFCLNIKKDQMKNAKMKIRNFVDEFISEFEAPNKNSNQTYQLNVQLFSLTKNKGDL